MVVTNVNFHCCGSHHLNITVVAKAALSMSLLCSLPQPLSLLWSQHCKCHSCGHRINVNVTVVFLTTASITAVVHSIANVTVVATEAMSMSLLWSLPQALSLLWFTALQVSQLWPKQHCQCHCCVLYLSHYHCCGHSIANVTVVATTAMSM